ncbi:hypothetical protein [Flavobacterium sp.]|uniref:hypothetical protein n=1 Tax=Flavobacterium sp. TaxID=239 RepID=UPI002D0A0C9B|nr:hypothetical protein [Flavobacterium sp.]HSD07016.1 hypothetical protein [Flavobacterium sp.]
MKTLSLTILTILTLGFHIPKKETIFLGTVKTDTKNKDNIFGLYIEFRVDTLIIARNIIQQDGTFKISATADKDFDIYYRGIGVGDTYVQTIKATEKDTVSLTFKIPKDYKKHFGKTVCPKCNKHDQTVPIRYGLGSSIIVRHINSQGDTIYTPKDNKKYYDGGCVTSDIDSKYFCERDKIKF